MITIGRFLLTVLSTTTLAVLSTAAMALDLDGAFSLHVVRPSFLGTCPPTVAGECGVIEFVGLGTADWVYVFGPLFESDGHKCFDVDGMLTISLHADGSTMSGPLTGIFCPREADLAHQLDGRISNGNPFYEDDRIQFTAGTGQFAALQGTAIFHTFRAGALFQGSLTGTLSGSQGCSLLGQMCSATLSCCPNAGLVCENSSGMPLQIGELGSCRRYNP